VLNLGWGWFALLTCHLILLDTCTIRCVYLKIEGICYMRLIWFKIYMDQNSNVVTRRASKKHRLICSCRPESAWLHCLTKECKDRKMTNIRLNTIAYQQNNELLIRMKVKRWHQNWIMCQFQLSNLFFLWAFNCPTIQQRKNVDSVGQYTKRFLTLLLLHLILNGIHWIIYFNTKNGINFYTKIKYGFQFFNNW
jgi:hypothetical protein